MVSINSVSDSQQMKLYDYVESDENIEIKKNMKTNKKRIEYICNNFATQFVQLIVNCGMLWLLNQGNGVKQPRPTDKHNTLINRHWMGGGGVF